MAKQHRKPIVAIEVPTQHVAEDPGKDEQIWTHETEANILPHTLAYAHALPHLQNMRVLDICCGTGYGTKLISEVANKVIGIDYSTHAIAYADAEHPSNVKFLCANVETTTIDDEIDVVTCMQGLEHLDDPKAVIEKYKDKLWLFALPRDKNESNSYHHHVITETTIQEWFPKAKMWFFDDMGHWGEDPFGDFTNYFGMWRVEG